MNSPPARISADVIDRFRATQLDSQIGGERDEIAQRTVTGRTPRTAALLLLSLSLLGMGQCSVKKTEHLPPEKILPLQTATREELLARLQQQAAAVRSINAVTELVPSTGSAYSGVIEQYHDVRAFVLA